MFWGGLEVVWGGLGCFNGHFISFQRQCQAFAFLIIKVRDPHSCISLIIYHINCIWNKLNEDL